MMEDQTQLSQLVVPLLKGVVYRERGEAEWQALVLLQGRIIDYVAVLGLELVVDEAEGYAFLKSKELTEDDPKIPRLIARHPLSYGVSLMLALLRKKLVEFDATGGDTRLILSRHEIHEMMRVFLPPGTNEARERDKVDSDLDKVVKLGFCRKLRGQDDQFEVRRVLKAFVDAQWLSELEQTMASAVVQE